MPDSQIQIVCKSNGNSNDNTFCLGAVHLMDQTTAAKDDAAKVIQIQAVLEQ